jgi:uncharacterized YigZ family protein
MANIRDTFRTISKPSNEFIFKDRGSKFIGYSFPISSEEQAKELLGILKKEHYNAKHWCYAWQLGEEYSSFRVNDDGEPSNTAGMPIYGQLKSFDLTNTLVVVVRYFGGTKLGVGGLINAYRSAAKMALESSKIIEKTIDEQFKLEFDYSEMNIVMRLIKENNITIKDQVLEMDCMIIITVRKKEAMRIFDLFSNTYKINISRIND